MVDPISRIMMSEHAKIFVQSLLVLTSLILELFASPYPSFLSQALIGYR